MGGSDEQRLQHAGRYQHRPQSIATDAVEQGTIARHDEKLLGRPVAGKARQAQKHKRQHQARHRVQQGNAQAA